MGSQRPNTSSNFETFNGSGNGNWFYVLILIFWIILIWVVS